MRPLWLLPLAIAASACNPDFGSPTDNRPCSASGACLPGYACIQNVCVALAGADGAISTRDGGALPSDASEAEDASAAEVDAGSAADFDAGPIADFDAGPVAGLDAGTATKLDASSLAGLDAGSASGLDAGSIFGLDVGSVAGLDAGSVAGLDAGSVVVGLDAGSVAGLDAAAPAGLDAAAPAGLDAAAPAGLDAAAPAGLDAAAPAGLDAAAPAGLDAGPVPTCTDGIQNGSETDKDCGGGSCPPCAYQKACKADLDCLSNSCTSGKCDAPPSCRAILIAWPASPSGIYTIDPDGSGPVAPFPVYCDQVGDGGGWTLALKMAGNSTFFPYTAAYWTNGLTLNPGLPDLDLNEAMLMSFSTMPFTELRVGMRVGSTTRYVPVKIAASSATTLFTGAYQATTVGRGKWKSLLVGSSLEPNCNREGINNANSYYSVRLGIVGNNESDCNSTDSGLGLAGSGVISGNLGSTLGDFGNATIQATGYLELRYAPTCTDGAKDGDETDLDCGGSCSTCDAGKKCLLARDCFSGVCSGGLCAGSCTDNIKDGSEIDVDCGGPCPACGVGRACGGNTDCASAFCFGNRCWPASCLTGCGTICPTLCGTGGTCSSGADCTSQVCTGNICQAPTCSDGVQNGDEQGVDCGSATEPSCPGCNPSCPLIFAWDGTSYRYETDLQGPGIGLPPSSPMNKAVPLFAPEYVVINDLVPDATGFYDLKVREVLTEITYLDQTELLVVDAPAGYEVYSSTAQSTYSLQYQDPFTLITAKDAILPIAATDQDGNDILPSVIGVDDYPAPAHISSLDYYTFDFGPVPDASNAKLLIDGWGVYTGIPQGGTSVTPFIEVQDSTGAWVSVVTFGRPAGDLKTMVVQIPNVFLSDSQLIRLHLGTNTNSRWVIDRIRLDTSAPVSVSVQELFLSASDLHHAGRTGSIATLQHRFLAEDVSLPDVVSSYGFGAFTAYGDVTPLLSDIDDMYAILRHGDELTMSFPPALPQAPDTTRFYLLKGSLFYKGFRVDDTVTPLPFHEMTTYEYSPPQAYPTDPAHQDYLTNYNTRVFP